jgi:uncharacterized protein YjbJ (UPF0337 family)
MASGNRLKRKARSLFEIAMGRAKRATGELTASPDIVLEGEEQETEGLRQRNKRR